MRDIAFETVVEAGGLLVESCLALLLGAAGLMAERAGIAQLGSGLDPLTGWYLFMGAWGLFVGAYLLGYRRVVPRLRRMATHAGD